MSHNFKNFLYGALCLVLFTCTENSEKSSFDSIEVSQIETQFLFEIPKPGNQEFFFGTISDVKILADGSFAVLDDLRKNIHIFSPDGNLRGSKLNEGRGPGEVMIPHGHLQVSEDGKISVYDQGLQRVSIYELNEDRLSVIQDVNIENMISSHYLLPEGALVLYEPKPLWESNRKDRVLISNLSGSINSQIAEFEGNEQLILSPLTGDFTMGISSQYHTRNLVCFQGKYMIYNRSDQVGFSVYDLDNGNVINEVKMKRPGISLPIDKREDVIDEIIESGVANRDQRSRLLAEMPENYPLVQAIKCDSIGHIWLNIFEDEDQPVWIVFTEVGKLIGKLNTDFGDEIINVHKSFIFAQSEDQNGNKSIHVYQYNIH